MNKSILLLRLRILSTQVAFAVARLLPVRRRVVLGVAQSGRISGNLAAIRDALAAEHPEIPVVELVRRPQGGRRGKVGQWLFGAKAGWYLATSAVFVVEDYFFPLFVIKRRPGTYVVQVWHAAGAFKQFGYSLRKGEKTFGAKTTLLDRVRIHTNYDLALVSSMRFAPYYAEAFGQPESLFSSELGMARTDVLCDPTRREEAAARVRATLDLPEGRRVVLYAPTFRGDTITSARYEDDLDLEVLHKAVGDDVVVLMRLHPFVRDALVIPESMRDFAIDASGLPDINELMLVSDVLVTDYSSSIYEFALLGRPIVLFAPDHDRYVAERGFYFDDYVAGVPGPVVESTEQLGEVLARGEYDLERVRAFAAESFDVADGTATQRFVEQVVLPRVTR